MTVSRGKRGRQRGLAPGFLPIGLIIAWALAGPTPAFAGQKAGSAAGEKNPFADLASDSTSEEKKAGAGQKTGSAPAAKSDYVGIAACTKEGCHEPETTSYLTSSHGRQSSPYSPSASHECESCHGPGRAHMNNPRAEGKTQSFKTMSPRDASTVCLTTCHERYGQEADYVDSMHGRRNMSCVDCHSQHRSKSTRALLNARTDSDTCYACHKSERAKTLRTSHHPVREGKMGCSSCHNPHDGTRPKMLQAESVNELCYMCHAEKRGPFLYEHAAAREDCQSCHDPHGSNHPRMLRAKAPFMCQQCHYEPSHEIAGDLSNTLAGVAFAGPDIAGVAQATRSLRYLERSCSNCHVAIHGSNSPSGQSFVR